MQHNEDEVEPYLKTFVSDVWQLLMACTLDIGQDRLAISGMTFLTAVSHTVHHTLFASEDILKQVSTSASVFKFKIKYLSDALIQKIIF